MRGIAVILAAAGPGKRFGGNRPKQFHKLGGIPILDRTMAFFVGYPGVCEISLAAPVREIPSLERQVTRWHGKPAIHIVKGGKTRQESVERALAALTTDCKWVAVHDVVRPLLNRPLFAAVLRGARQSGAAIPAVAVTDTLKRIDAKGFICETIPRESYVQVQTPQVFRRDILLKAFRRARRDGFVGTDEAMLVERLGVPVKVVPGSRHNLKVTVPEDLRLAEWLVRDGKAQGR